MKSFSISRRFILPALAALLVAGSFTVVAHRAEAANLLRGALALSSGEDPTVPGTVDPLFVAAGDGRLTDQGLLRVGMSFLDAARFPAGTLADVRIGGVSAQVALTPFAPEVPGATDNPLGATTAVNFRTAGTARAGDRIEVRIRSEVVVNGVRQRHETRWAGTLQ